MQTLARLTQRFNHAFPWHQPKTGLVKRVGRKMDRAGGPREVDGIAGSLRMKLDLASDYELAIAMNSYEMVIVSLMRRLLKAGDTFVDGGANLGVLSLIGGKLVGPTGKVVAFEPQPAAVVGQPGCALGQDLDTQRRQGRHDALVHRVVVQRDAEVVVGGVECAAVGRREGLGVAVLRRLAVDDGEQLDRRAKARVAAERLLELAGGGLEVALGTEGDGVFVGDTGLRRGEVAEEVFVLAEVAVVGEGAFVVVQGRAVVPGGGGVVGTTQVVPRGAPAQQQRRREQHDAQPTDRPKFRLAPHGPAPYG